MRRREFIGLVGGAAAWPAGLCAQQSGRKRVVGVLMTHASESIGSARIQMAAFRDELSKRGWADGRNIQIEVRWTGARIDLVEKYAAELVAMQSDVIVTSSAPLVAALQAATSTIPIVFFSTSAPVALGLVKDLARPGGNTTGFTGFEPSLGGKWVELMKEIAPAINHVTVLFTAKGAPNASFFMKFIETAGAAKQIRCVTRSVDQSSVHFPSLMEELAQDPDGGVILLPDAFTAGQIEQIVPAALKFRLPLMAPFPAFARAGGLAAYGINVADQVRRTATYVDRILRGEKPGDLPVQEPTTFELVINLKAAKALGLIVPPSLLARADEVVE
jgi:putative tryptophan/tyrosine transport system substrate-binding protein